MNTWLSVDAGTTGRSTPTRTHVAVFLFGADTGFAVAQITGTF
jgi:hypothetical protein